MSQFKSRQAGIVLNCPQLFEGSGILGGSDGKESSHNVEDMGLITRLGRSPEEENGNPLQYSCLQNTMAEEPGRLQSMESQSQTQLSN